MSDLPASPGHGSHESREVHEDGTLDLNVREQDLLLPIETISQIMKQALPAKQEISKDAEETVQEGVSVFIGFITSEAWDKCQREKRKTITGDDLLWALKSLGFEEFVEPLKLYLQREGYSKVPKLGEISNHGGSQGE